MSEQNKNKNIEKEEIEHLNKEQNNQEYEEENDNQMVEEEEGQEFAVAFDIQINEASYILLIGKTENSKLIIRLVDKDDENKPFYQNEFSLEELKEINNYFVNFTNENDAIDSVIKHLNENDKEIEILDENNIKLTVQINEGDGTNVDFILPKIIYELEGEEEQIDKIKNMDNGINIQNEEEGEEEMENYEEMNQENIEEAENIDHEEANLEYSEDNNEKNGQILNPIQEQNVENKMQAEPNNNIEMRGRNQKKKILLGTILEDFNENNLSKNQSRRYQEPNNDNENNMHINSFEIKEENKEKPKEVKKNGGETKISKVIEELKDNLDSLGGAMNYIEQDEEQQKQNLNQNEINDNKIKDDGLNIFKNEILNMINRISDNFNEQLKKQNDYFNSQQKIIKDENDKKIKDLMIKLDIKNNELNNIKNNFNKILNDKINNLQNKINEDIKNIKNQENSSGRRYERDSYIRNNELDKVTNNMNSKIKDIEQKLNTMKIEINKTNKNNDNTTTKSLLDKINNFENRLKKNEESLFNNTKSINEKKNNTDNKITAIENKLNSLETSIRERKNLSEKIFSFENKLKILESRFNNFEKNKKGVNDNKELVDRINNLENLINEIETEKNESELYFKETIDELNKNEIISKVNNLINLTNRYDNDIKNLNESFNNIMKSIEQLNEKNENILMAQKESKDLYQKINISSGEKKSPSSNLKQYKMKNKPQKNIVKKNYRVITPLDEDSAGENKRYKSHTYDRRNQLTSHSVNSLNIRPKNYIENNIEYQIDAKSNSKSKGNNDEENSNGSKRINSKYRFKKYSYSNLNINPYTNGINDSYILQEEDFAFIDNRLRELYPNNDISYNLVYRATEDGDKASDFHQRCDKIGPNITLVKTRNGYIFGGFTMKNWEHLKRDINENKPNLGSASRDVRAFGFSVNYQKIYNNERKNEFAIWCNRNYGPTFKNNFFQIFDNSLKFGGHCSSRKNSHFGGQKYDFEITGGESRFTIYEVEVFEIIIQ